MAHTKLKQEAGVQDLVCITEIGSRVEKMKEITTEVLSLNKEHVLSLTVFCALWN